MHTASLIVKNLGLKEVHVEQVIALLNDGSTIPFISRYRKEATGGMNEVEVANVSNEYERLGELQKRREYILQSIEG